MKTLWPILAPACLALLSACAQRDTRPDPALALQQTPAEVLELDPATLRDRSFTWGGAIQTLSNQAEDTRLEILAYPLDQRRRPIKGEPSGGRFLVDMDGFLEPRELPPGTLVTVEGHFKRLVIGKVGESDYLYPLLRGDNLEVWQAGPMPTESARPSVRWSIGVGSGGGGFGVGIGF